MKWWKSLLAGGMAVCALSGIGFAQQGTGQDTTREPYCPPHEFQLQGATNAKQNTPVQYSIVGGDSINEDYTLTFEVWQGDENITAVNDTVLAHSFAQTGTYLIKAIIATESDCRYVLEEPVDVFTELWLYMGPASSDVEVAVEKVGDPHLYVEELLIQDNENIYEKVVQERYYVQYADKIFIHTAQLGRFFEQLDNLDQFAPLTLEEKQLFVVSSVNKSTFRRLAARYHELLGDSTIHVIADEYLGALFTALLLDKSVESLPFVRSFSTSLSTNNTFLVLSYLVDYLLYQGFPLSTLTMILLLPVLALVISIFRQVIGFSVFGVFNPLLFAISLLVLGVVPSIILFASAFIATALLRLFTQRLYLLYSAKIALLIVMYVIVIIAFLRVDHTYLGQQISIAEFRDVDILFPMLFLLAVGKKVFSEKFYLFDAGWWIGLIEFLILSFVIYWLFSRAWLQNLFLGYPELLLLVLILNIIVGRFAGLQLLEYVRFMPLLRERFKSSEGEEE